MATTTFSLHAEQMLRTHPGPAALDRDRLLQCLQACLDCAQACVSCADACLGEREVAKMVRCIRLNEDCAAVCEATGRVLSRQTAFEPSIATPLLQACIAACRACAEECARHGAHMEHCRVCAEACRRCEQACVALAGTLSPARA